MSVHHSTGASGVANRPGHQPAGQLPLHPGQQHCPTGREIVLNTLKTQRINSRPVSIQADTYLRGICTICSRGRKCNEIFLTICSAVT